MLPPCWILVAPCPACSRSFSFITCSLSSAAIDILFYLPSAFVAFPSTIFPRTGFSFALLFALGDALLAIFLSSLRLSFSVLLKQLRLTLKENYCQLLNDVTYLLRYFYKLTKEYV